MQKHRLPPSSDIPNPPINHRHKLVSVMINENGADVTLAEQVGRVHSAKLVYFKLANWDSVTGPPHFLFLQVGNISSNPDIVPNVVKFRNTTLFKPLATEAVPLHFRPDPVDPVAGTMTLSGNQKKCMAWKTQDFNSFKSFTLTLLGDDQLPLAFTNDTVALFVFEVSYEGQVPIPVEYASRFRS